MWEGAERVNILFKCLSLSMNYQSPEGEVLFYSFLAALAAIMVRGTQLALNICLINE